VSHDASGREDGLCTLALEEGGVGPGAPTAVGVEAGTNE